MSSVIIGHSQVKYVKSYLTEDSVTCLCFPGYRIEDFINEECILDIVPSFSVVVLVVGANDVVNSNPTSILRDISELCRLIHLSNPSANVVLTNILPRGQNHFHGRRLPATFLQRYNQEASEVNTLLEEFSMNETWLSYNSVNFQCSNGDVLREYLSRDGLHLSFHGTGLLSECIENVIRKVNCEHVLQNMNCSQQYKESGNEKRTFIGPKLYSEAVSIETVQLSTPNIVNKPVKEAAPRNVNSHHRLNVKQYTSDKKTRKLQRHRAIQPKNQKANAKPIKLCNQSEFYTNRFSVLNVEKLPKRKSSENEVLVQRKSCQPKAYVMKKDVFLIESEKLFYLSTDSNIQTGGGLDNETKVYSKTDRALTYNDALDLLLNAQSDSVITEPPYCPSAGSVFVYTDGGDKGKNEDWKCDGYTWRNYGKHVQQVDEHLVEKTYFRIKNADQISDKFQKHVFRLSPASNIAVIVYLGQESEYVPLPHGNRKKNNRVYKRTKPSVLQNIQQIDEKPHKVANDMGNEKPKHLQGISFPRNTKQVKNIQSKQRAENKLSHDSLYGLHLLVEQLNGFILHVKTVPDLEVMVGLKETFEEFNRLLQLKDENINIFYDTTFDLGDFYVSTLAYQHIMFAEKPCIPVAFMIHERKFQKCHEQFLEVVKLKVPKLKTTNINVVTDREIGIINAFQSVFPLSKLFVCWNHLLRDLSFWLSKHGGSKVDKQVYETHLKTMLHSENLEQFLEKYQELKVLWSEPMVEYFEKNLKDTIINHAGRWVLEESNNYNPYSGITNNCSESVNAKLKRLVDNETQELDAIVLYFYYLQNNDFSDIIGGFCGESEWTLLKKYSFAKLNPETVEIPSRKCNPENIIDLVKGNLKLSLQSHNSECSDTTLNIEEIQKECSSTKNTDQKHSSNQLHSQKSLAISTVNDNGIVLVPSMGAFMVKGSKGEKYSVTLFPKESCNCPSTTRCYHIISAMISIGMEIPNDIKKMNLSQLRKNSRPRNNKKCGTKKGRIGDRDEDIINAAPDSEKKRKIIYSPESPNENIHNVDSVKLSSKSLRFGPSKLDDNTNDVTTLTPKSPKTPRSILKKNKRSPVSDSNLKIPKKIKTESENEAVEFIEFSSPRIETESINDDWWLQELGLTESDKNVILKNKKLTSNHMEAVNKICRKQFRSIAGFQLTEKVPVFLEDESRWNIGSVMLHVNEDNCVQIHHTGKDHWVTSLKFNNVVHLIDSLGTDRPENAILTQSLKIQLSQIYGKMCKNTLNIQIPETQRQNNSVDCGVFAIAHLVEFCITSSFNNKVIFDTKQMRSHLLDCFENESFTPFPKTNKSLNNRRNKPIKSISIDLQCICNLPSCVDKLIVCDECSTPYHENCVSSPGHDFSKPFICECC